MPNSSRNSTPSPSATSTIHRRHASWNVSHVIVAMFFIAVSCQLSVAGRRFPSLPAVLGSDDFQEELFERNPLRRERVKSRAACQDTLGDRRQQIFVG